jgi:hypothetical protein
MYRYRYIDMYIYILRYISAISKHTDFRLYPHTHTHTHPGCKRGGKRCAAPAEAPVAFDPPSGFALGSNGSASCPSGTAIVLGPAECQNAAASAARPHSGKKGLSTLPSGCVWFTGNVGRFFFNSAVSRKSNYYAQPVCAGAP